MGGGLVGMMPGVKKSFTIPHFPDAPSPRARVCAMISNIAGGIRKCYQSRRRKRNIEKQHEQIERLPSWAVLGAEFTNRTTWHGLKYLALPSRFIIRRFIWAGILLCNAALFLFIMSSNLQKLLSNPISINVQVSDNNSLPFAAVTVCNDNRYRLTALQEYGLYDLMVNDNSVENSSDGPECDKWEMLPGICTLPESFLDKPDLDMTTAQSSVVDIEEVTRAVCRRLCTNAYNLTCSSVLYNRARRNCTLSAYTGDWVDGDVNNTHCTESNGLEFYRRKRCISVKNFYCNFEDNQCVNVLTNDTTQKDQWRLITAKDQPVVKDNSLNLESGHILNFLMTETRPGYKARVQSPYMNTTDKCLVLFYWFQVDDPITTDAATLSVILTTEELDEIIVTSKRTGPSDWTRLFVPLLGGVHRVVVEASRGVRGASGVSIDDVSVQKCSQMKAKADCKVTRLGKDYLGTRSFTSDGEPCLPWDSINNPIVTRLPDLSTKDAQNFCRNIPQEGWQQPSCFVSTRSGGMRPSECSIPFCECGTNYFQCDNKMCIPKQLLCNGVDDCLDRSDELTPCQSLRSVQCLFADDYMCGYELGQPIGLLQWKRESASDLSYYSSAAISSNVSVLEQLVFLDSKLGEEGDQIQLISPLWTFKQPTLMDLTYVMMGTSQQAVAGLFLYQYSQLHVPVRQLLSATNFGRTDLQESQVCVPAGTYHLMVLGVQGVRYQSDIGLDIVNIIGQCNETFPPLVCSFNCSFSWTCGYVLQTTSALINASIAYTKNAFRPLSNTVCSNIFFEVDGTITSPGFPANYANNLECIFRIEEADFATIEITFLSFSLEAQDDCLYDSLQITDDSFNETDIYCGDTLPPPYRSKGNNLTIVFRTDATITSSGFKFSYSANIVNATPSDYMLNIKYAGSTADRHSARLTSPPARIVQDSCLRITFVANANFNISLGYISSAQNYSEFVLFSSPDPLGLGSAWQRIRLDLKTLDCVEHEVVIILETGMGDKIASAFLLADVTLLPSKCRENVSDRACLNCSFTHIDQCGYLDRTIGPLGWARVYDGVTNQFYMRALFEATGLNEIVLQSAPISLNFTSCLKMSYFTSSRNHFMTIIFDPPQPTADNNNTFRLVYGVEHLFLTLPVGEYSLTYAVFENSGLSSASDGHDMSPNEVRIYEVLVLPGNCPATDDSVGVSCTFEDVFICDYMQWNPFGLPWSWVNINNYQLDGISFNLTASNVNTSVYVMIFNHSTTDSPVVGSLLSPLLHTKTSQVITLDVYKTDQSQLSVYKTTVLGEVSRLLYVSNISVVNQWQTVNVCLPVGDYHLGFLAQPALGRFLAIDNVQQTQEPCNDTSEFNYCSDPDLTNCKNQKFSWSSLFTWTYTSDIHNDSVTPAGDGCVHVFREISGLYFYNQTGKSSVNTSCDIYINGIGNLLVEVMFEKFTVQQCSTQYIEIWWYQEGAFKSNRYCETLQNQTAPFIFNTSDVIQIHVQGTLGFPTFTLRYTYEPVNMTNYALALVYIGDNSETQTLDIANVAQLSSQELNLTNHESVCVQLDMALPASTLDIVLVQIDTATIQTQRTTVFESDAYGNYRVEWAEGVFQVDLDQSLDLSRVQFVFYLSLSNYALSSDTIKMVGAINYLYIVPGPCQLDGKGLDDSEPCSFGQGEFCGFMDDSIDISKWILVAERSTFINTDKCKVRLDGSTYMGTVNTTISGRQCQRWDSQYPQQHNQDVAAYFPDATLADAANYCRNPTNPFIPRTTWCYTMEPNQRREYCDIPFCLVYFLHVAFLANHVSRATVVSPPLLIPHTDPTCLSFTYKLTSPFVTLEVAVTSLKDKVQRVLVTFSIDATPLIIDWTRANVELPGGTDRVYFIADKTDLTEFNEIVSLDNVSLSTGLCPQSGQNVSSGSNRLPYTGLRLERTAYKDLVLEDISEYDIRNLTQLLAHQLPELVQSCSFGGTDCDSSYFTTEFTELGLCYTFNFDPSQMLYTTVTGADYGAQLVLNVESYEHVKGYVSSVGVKIHLHDQMDIPKPQVLGFSAPPAMHSLAVLGYTQTTSLPPPYGTCGNINLEYYGGDDPAEYTAAKCQRQMETTYIDQSCGCKDVYMPGPSQYCSLRQYLNCTQPQEELYRLEASATCPLSCAYNTYSTELSQSKLSGLALNKLFGATRSNISYRYTSALEMRHRVTEDYMLTTICEIMTIIDAHKALKQYVYFAILDRGTSIAGHIEQAVWNILQLATGDIKTNGDSLFDMFYSVYERQLLPILDFLSSAVRKSFADLGMFKEILIGIQRSGNLNRLHWYNAIFNSTARSLQDLENVIEWFSDDFQNTTLNNPHIPSLFVVGDCMANLSLPVLRTLITEASTMTKRLEDTQLPGHLPPQDVITDAMLNNIQDTIDAIVDFANCTGGYGAFLTTVMQWLGSLDLTAKNYSSAINAETVLVALNDDEAWLQELIDGYISNKLTKNDLQAMMHSGREVSLIHRVEQTIQDIQQFVIVPTQTTLSALQQTLTDDYFAMLQYCARLFAYTWNDDVNLYARALKIWRGPLPNLDLPQKLSFATKVEYSFNSNETWQVWPATTDLNSFVQSNSLPRLASIAIQYFDPLRQQMTSVQSELTTLQDAIVAAVNTLLNTLDNFHDSLSLDESFADTNFLAIDIFFGEMKFQTISQSAAYVWTNFFSDMGSYFGLLMGCSILTFIEVIDLAVYYGIIKLIERYVDDRKPKRRDVIEVRDIVIEDKPEIVVEEKI